MNRQERKVEETKLAVTVNRLLDEMDTFGPGTPEYNDALDQLERIYAMKKTKNKFSKGVDPNTVVVVAGNFAIALLVVAYEQKNVIGTKLRDFLLKNH